MNQRRLTQSLIAAFAFAAAAPSLLMAQASVTPPAALMVIEASAANAVSPATTPTVAFGPYVARSGVTRAVAATEATLHLQQGNVGGRNVALMLIGGATLVVGSVIGGDAGTIIMITGGVIGLTGLWRYLQ